MSRLIKYALIIVFLRMSVTVMAHPLHLTITNIDINNDSIKVAVRLFADEFRLNVLNNSNISDSQEMVDPTLEKKQIVDFMNAGFQLFDNDSRIRLNYIRKEKDDLSVWLFFESPLNKKPKGLTIENSIFMDKYNDQKNMVIVSINGDETGLEFVPGDTKKSITLTP